MAEIQLTQPTQVGPGRAGAVKQPFSLADRSGQRQLGQAIEQVGGDLERRLTGAKAANEEAVFRGVTETELTGYDNFVKTNPNASLDQLKKEQEAMMGRIKTASNESSTGIAKRNNTNWLAVNEDRLNKEAKDNMIAVKTRQEIDTYDILQKINMANLDKGAYSKLKNDMVSRGLLSKEIYDAQEELDHKIIDNALDKIEDKSNVDLALGLALGQRDGFNRIDISEAEKSIDSDGNLTSTQKVSVKNTVRAEKAVEERRLAAKEKGQQTANQSTILTDIARGELTGSQIRTKMIEELQVKPDGTVGLTPAMFRALDADLNKSPEIVTSLDTNISVRRLIQDVKLGKVSQDEAIARYSAVASTVSPNDSEQFLDDIFRAAETPRNSAQKTLDESVSRHVKLLRDNIVTPDPFGLIDTTGIKTIFADEAEIELFDLMREGEFTEDDIKRNTNNLIRKFSVSTSAIIAAQADRAITQAQNVEQQAAAYQSAIAQFEKIGDITSATEARTEAQRRGILTEDNKAGKGKKKDDGKISIFQRLLKARPR